MKYTILVTNIMDKKYFVGNIYVCKDSHAFNRISDELSILFGTLGYRVEREDKIDNEDTIAYIRIERIPTNGNNDTNY